jgi:pyruvate carboxylase subunit B
MIWFVTVMGRVLEVARDAEGFVVDGRRVEASLSQEPGSAELHLTLDGEPVVLGLDGHGAAGWRVVHEGATHEVRVEDERTRELRSRAPVPQRLGGAALLKAPMPGLVVRIAVHEGEVVAAGAGVLVLEAMKMENELKAPRAGVIKRLRVAAGQTVEKGAVLLEIGAEEG